MGLFDCGIYFIYEFEHDINVKFSGIGQFLLCVHIFAFKLIGGNWEITLIESLYSIWLYIHSYYINDHCTAKGAGFFSSFLGFYSGLFLSWTLIFLFSPLLTLTILAWIAHETQYLKDRMNKLYLKLIEQFGDGGKILAFTVGWGFLDIFLWWAIYNVSHSESCIKISRLPLDGLVLSDHSVAIGAWDWLDVTSVLLWSSVVSSLWRHNVLFLKKDLIFAF